MAYYKDENEDDKNEIIDDDKLDILPIDITIFHRALKFFLRACGERAEADDGYRGEPLYVDLPTEGCFYRAL
jgi:hypothetical protein